MKHTLTLIKYEDIDQTKVQKTTDVLERKGYCIISVPYPPINWRQVMFCSLFVVKEPANEQGGGECPENDGVQKPHVPTNVPGHTYN